MQTPSSYYARQTETGQDLFSGEKTSQSSSEIFQRRRGLARPLVGDIDLSSCCVKGCDNPAEWRGFCSAHYQRLMKRGGDVRVDLRKTRVMTATTCSVDGCERQAKVRGMCSMHYQRARISGDITIRPTQKVLSFQNHRVIDKITKPLYNVDIGGAR